MRLPSELDLEPELEPELELELEACRRPELGRKAPEPTPASGQFAAAGTAEGGRAVAVLEDSCLGPAGRWQAAEGAER